MSWIKRYNCRILIVLMVAISFVPRAILLYHNHIVWSSAGEHLDIANAFEEGSYRPKGYPQHPLYGLVVFAVNIIVGDLLVGEFEEELSIRGLVERARFDGITYNRPHPVAIYELSADRQ